MSAARDLVYSFVNRIAPGSFGDGRTAVEGGSDEDLYLHGLLNRVEDDRAHAEAELIRGVVANDKVYRPKWQRGMLEAADLIDPYKELDGQLVRKSDGKPVVI